MANFLLEVGTEELPANFVSSAITQWQQNIPQSLTEQFLNPVAVEYYGTPRRLAILLKDLPERQADREEVIKGPPVKAAFKDGKATPAAEGFARKQGVDLANLKILDTDKGEFVFIQKQIPGRQTKEILAELVLQWITGLEGKRFMRWGDGDLRFPRPIRWLVALWDREVLPLALVNGSTTIQSDRISRGHRVLHPQAVSIAQATDYVETMRSAAVEVDSQQRKAQIEAAILAEAQVIGGKAEIYPDLLAEVIDLVEYPTAVLGNFEAKFLTLPTAVITTVMVNHQRYFPVHHQGTGNTLLPNFITIANGDPAKKEMIAEGNQRVIRARLADAQFFYQADCDEHLDTYLPALENVTFQEDLGSMRDKVDRIIDTGRKGVGLGDTVGGTISNLTVNNVNLAGEHAQNHDAAGVKLFNTTNINVSNNQFSNINAHSIWNDTTTGTAINNNVINDVGADYVAPGFNSEVGGIAGIYNEKSPNSSVSGNNVNAVDDFLAFNATSFTVETLSLGENDFSNQELGTTDFYANEQAERLVATTENPTEANFDLFAQDYYAQAIIGS